MVNLAALGLLAGVAAALAGFAFFHFSWDRHIGSEVTLLQASAAPMGQVVTEQMLDALPEAGQRYLRQSGVVGTPIPSRVRLRQEGRIRRSADAAWMSFDAEQYYTTNPPGFVWRAWLPSAGFPVVMGRDVYLRGDSNISMRAFGMVAVADQRGPDMAAAGLMRYLNEMMWFPASYLGDNISWAELDANSARVTITDRGLQASAVLHFDDDGRLINFIADRFNTETGRIETWETPISRYGRWGGLDVPSEGQAVWVRPESGDRFTYIEIRITEIAYD